MHSYFSPISAATTKISEAVLQSKSCCLKKKKIKGFKHPGSLMQTLYNILPDVIRHKQHARGDVAYCRGLIAERNGWGWGVVVVWWKGPSSNLGWHKSAKDGVYLDRVVLGTPENDFQECIVRLRVLSNQLRFYYNVKFRVLSNQLRFSLHC